MYSPLGAAFRAAGLDMLLFSCARYCRTNLLYLFLVELAINVGFCVCVSLLELRRGFRINNDYTRKVHAIQALVLSQSAHCAPSEVSLFKR